MDKLHTWRTEPTLDQSTTTAPGGSAKTEWLYDTQRGWLIEKNYDGENDDPQAATPVGTADYTYTKSGRLKSRTWERGVVTSYAYNRGSLASVTYSGDATYTPNLTYTYDNFGRPLIVKQS